MNEQQLADMLRRADATAGPLPEMAPNCAARVRRTARRRRVTTVTGATATALIVLVVGIASWRTRGEPGLIADGNRDAAKERLTPDVVERLRAEIRELEAQADSSSQIVKLLLAYEKRQQRLSRLRRELAKPDPIEKVRREIDKTAFIMVYQADRLCREPDRPPACVNAYQRVIELFPKTRAARVARERLSEIEIHEGGLL